MRAYFNNSESYINIEGYNHTINFTPDRVELYNFNLSLTENVVNFIETYASTVITDIKIDKGSQTVLNLNNMTLRLYSYIDSIEELGGRTVQLSLVNT